MTKVVLLTMNSDNLTIYTGNIVCSSQESKKLVEQVAIVVKDGEIIAKNNINEVLEHYSYSS